MAEATTRPIEILLVEDSAADVRLTVEALKEAKVKNKLTVVEDGVKALAYLNKQGDYANAIRPDLILLFVLEICAIRFLIFLSRSRSVISFCTVVGTSCTISGGQSPLYIASRAGIISDIILCA